MKLSEYLQRETQVPAIALESLEDLALSVELSKVSMEAFELSVREIEQAQHLLTTVQSLSKAYVAKGDFSQWSLEHYHSAMDHVFMAHGLTQRASALMPSMEDALAIGSDAAKKSDNLSKNVVDFIVEMVKNAIAKVRELMKREAALSEKFSTQADQAKRLLLQVKPDQLQALAHEQQYSLPSFFIEGGHVNAGGVAKRLAAFFTAPSPMASNPVFLSLLGVQDSKEYKDKLLDTMDALTKQEDQFTHNNPELTDTDKAEAKVGDLNLQSLIQLADSVGKFAEQRAGYMRKVFDSHAKLIMNDTRRYEQLDRNAKDHDVSVQDALKATTQRFAIEAVYMRLNTRLNAELHAVLKGLQPYCNLGAKQQAA